MMLKLIRGKSCPEQLVDQDFPFRSEMQGVHYYIYSPSVEENEVEGSFPPTINQVLVKCSKKKKKTATGFTLRGKTTNGLQDEDCQVWNC